MDEENNIAPPVNPVNPKADKDGNEISLSGKFLAAFFLIFLTLFSALYLIGHWPDKLVTPGAKIKPLYTYNWFHVRLAGIPDNDFKDNNVDTIAIAATLTDSIKIDSVKKRNDTIKAAAKQREYRGENIEPNSLREKGLMHINTLLLILVAVAGFLGNMIYVSTSFTTYIGNGKFKNSWTMWYFVKPFTAAGLAVAIYFVFRGGFLNMSDDSTNINLYGLMTISILAGLFTDRTTLKLKEVFDVLLRPKDERSDTLTGNKPEVTTVDAPALEAGKPVLIKVNGKGFDKCPVVVKIEEKAIAEITKQPSTITFNYTLPAELKDKDSVKLQVVDDKGNAVGAPIQLPVKKSGGNSNQTPANAGVSNITVELKPGEVFVKKAEANDITTEDYKNATVKLTSKEGGTINLTNVDTDQSGKTFSASNVKFGSYALSASVLGEHYEAGTNGKSVIELVASSNVEIKEAAVSLALMLEMS